VFVAEKAFIGCQRQAVTDDVRVTIAARVCLLLLGYSTPDHFPRLRQIPIYPDALEVSRERPLGGGVVQEQRRVISGKSWAQGQVIMSWADVLAGAADPGDGRNVVLHKLAHQVDQDTGVADGRPWRPGPAKRRRWAAVMDEAFKHLQ